MIERKMMGGPAQPVYLINPGDLSDAGTATAANTPQIRTAAYDLPPNAARRLWSVQNLGTNPLYVRLGGTASSTEFHFALRAGNAADDGSGGLVVDQSWGGLVSVAGSSPRFVVLELTR